MLQTLRHPDILDIARREGRVTLEDLADRFGVTVQTIRRDLSELADAGRLQRVHGGAILPSGTTNIGYEYRRSLYGAEKHAIAQVCTAQIPDGASVFLNIGTSTEAVVRRGRRKWWPWARVVGDFHSACAKTPSIRSTPAGVVITPGERRRVWLRASA